MGSGEASRGADTLAQTEAEKSGRAELGVSAEQAREVASLLRYAVGLNTAAGLVFPTGRRLATPTYRAVELAARILEGESFEEAARGAEEAWTGSLERDHRRALELLRSHRDALRNAMSGRMDPERCAQYIEISEDQFMELLGSEMRPLTRPDNHKG